MIDYEYAYKRLLHDVLGIASTMIDKCQDDYDVAPHLFPFVDSLHDVVRLELLNLSMSAEGDTL